MRIDDIDPVRLMLDWSEVQRLAPRQVLLARPITLEVHGEHNPERGYHAQLYVFGVRPGEVYHTGAAPPAALVPGNGAGQVLAAIFPGVTIRERLPDGTVRTLVDYPTHTPPPPPPPMKAVPMPSDWPPLGPDGTGADGLAAAAGGDRVEDVSDYTGDAGDRGGPVTVELNLAAAPVAAADDDY